MEEQIEETAGIQFVDLSEASRIQISKWISSGASRNKVDQVKETGSPYTIVAAAPIQDNEKT